MKNIKAFLLSIILLLTISTGARAEFFSDIIVTSASGIWTDSRAYATLNDAITAVGANQRTVVIVGTQTVSTLTVPANVTLKFERDGMITNTGQLTINTKNIIAENRRIFTGPGNIDFASGTILKTGWFNNIESAFAVTTNDTVTLIVSKPQTITASYSPGNNVTLKWESPGNILTVNTLINVSNIGQIEAGNYQIMAGAGHFHFRDGPTLNLAWFTSITYAVTCIDTAKVVLEVNVSSPVAFSLSIPSNIQIKINRGGDLTIAGAQTLTLTSVKQVDIGPYYFNPFAGTGSVAITGGLTYTPATTLTALILSASSPGFIPYEVDALYDYGNGTSFTQATIQSALTAIGVVNKTTLLLRPGTWVISSNVDWSAYTNVTFKIVPGALISHGAFTMSIPNPDVGRYNWLSGTGIVTISGYVKEIYPEWWPGTDYGLQMTNAIASIANTGGKVRIGTGTATTPINATNLSYQIVFEGYGSGTSFGGSKITAAHTGVAFDLTGSNNQVFRDFTLHGDPTTSPTYGFLLARNSGGGGGGGHKFFNVMNDYTSEFTVASIYSYGSEVNSYYGCQFVNAYPAGKVFATSKNNSLVAASSFQTIATGAQSNTVTNLYGTDMIALGGTGAIGIYIEGALDFHVTGGWWYCGSGPLMQGGLAFVWIDTTTSASLNLSFEDITGEPAIYAPRYGFYIGDGVSSIVGLSIRDSQIYVAVTSVPTPTYVVYAHANITMFRFFYENVEEVLAGGVSSKGIYFGGDLNVSHITKGDESTIADSIVQVAGTSRDNHYSMSATSITRAVEDGDFIFDIDEHILLTQYGTLHDLGDLAAASFILTDLTTDGTWRDLDLSTPLTGFGASRYVLLRVSIQDDAAASTLSFRLNGNSNAINISTIATQVANVVNYADMWVKIDSTRKIEYNASNLTWSAITITVRAFIR